MTLTHDEYPLDYLFPSNAEVCVYLVFMLNGVTD